MRKLMYTTKSMKIFLAFLADFKLPYTKKKDELTIETSKLLEEDMVSNLKTLCASQPSLTYQYDTNTNCFVVFDSRI